MNPFLTSELSTTKGETGFKKTNLTRALRRGDMNKGRRGEQGMGPAEFGTGARARPRTWADRTPGEDPEAEAEGAGRGGLLRGLGPRGHRGSASQRRGTEGKRGGLQLAGGRAVPSRRGRRGLHRSAALLLPRSPAARHVRPQARAQRLRRGSLTAHGRNRGRLRRHSMTLERSGGSSDTPDRHAGLRRISPHCVTPRERQGATVPRVRAP